MLDISDNYLAILREHPLFTNLDNESFHAALSLYQAKINSYGKDEFLKLPGNYFSFFGLVLGGTVQVLCDDLEGNPMLMAHVTPGKTFGESFCFLKKETLVYVQAETDCDVLWLNPTALSQGTGALETMLLVRFSSLLANRTLQMNRRIQILSKKTIREKLMTYFRSVAPACGKPFEIPLSRNSLALYLGTDRSALSRELAAMKKDNIIDYDGNSFKILVTKKER